MIQPSSFLKAYLNALQVYASSYSTFAVEDVVGEGAHPFHPALKFLGAAAAPTRSSTNASDYDVAYAHTVKIIVLASKHSSFDLEDVETVEEMRLRSQAITAAAEAFDGRNDNRSRLTRKVAAALADLTCKSKDWGERGRSLFNAANGVRAGLAGTVLTPATTVVMQVLEHNYV